MKTFKEVLDRACNDAVEWVGNKTAEETIDQCYRGDWLLWFAKKVDVDRKLLILAASHCANTVGHLMPEESKKAVGVFIRYGEGKASEEEFANADVAAWAAWAARTAGDAENAAACAAWAAGAAADVAADAALAARAAARAAGAAADVAADAALAARAAARAAAGEANQKQTADICRKYLKEAILKNLKPT